MRFGPVGNNRGLVIPGGRQKPGMVVGMLSEEATKSGSDIGPK